MAVARLASLVVGNRFFGISEVALFTIMAMTTGRVVLTLEAHPS